MTKPIETISSADRATLLDALGLLQLAPFDHAEAVAPANSNIGPLGGLYVGVDGSVTIRLTSGADITYADCFAGQIIQAPIRQVRSTTTAGGLIGLSRVLDPAFAVADLIVEVAPADVNLPDGMTVALFVGTAGDLAVKMADSTTVTFTNVPASRALPLRVLQVRAATTAGNILASHSA